MEYCQNHMKHLFIFWNCFLTTLITKKGKTAVCQGGKQKELSLLVDSLNHSKCSINSFPNLESVSLLWLFFSSLIYLIASQKASEFWVSPLNASLCAYLFIFAEFYFSCFYLHFWLLTVRSIYCNIEGSTATEGSTEAQSISSIIDTVHSWFYSCLSAS